MEILLDSCTFLWICSDDKRLSARARDAFQSPENFIYLSSISVWEIAVKFKLNKLHLPENPEYMIPALRSRYKITALPLEEEPALYLARLPDLHRDPFDRMLVCQAVVHSLTILTPDKQINQYPVKTLW